VDEARFRAAIDGSLDAFLVLTCAHDDAGAVVDFVFANLNVKAAEVLGVPRERIIGQRLCELRPVNRTNGFFERYLRVFERHEVLEEEAVVPLPDGGRKWVHHQVVPLPDGVAITSRDVTRYRKLEADLRDALDAAERSRPRHRGVRHAHRHPNIHTPARRAPRRPRSPAHVRTKGRCPFNPRRGVAPPPHEGSPPSTR
jgi:PAS domain S-box-containing protein